MKHTYTHICTTLGSILPFILSITIIVSIFFLQSAFLKKNISESSTSTPFNAKALLANLGNEDQNIDFAKLETLVEDTVKKYGTKAGFELIDTGEKEGMISNDSCHELLHYVGHRAYAEHLNDFDALLNIVDGTHCMGGYVHGIEAEIVAKSSNMVEDVQHFCTFQKEHNINPGPCYHGVGHAAAELYNYDIPKSLATCDALIGSPENDMSNCYRGVFSQVGNNITGFDGHTGLKINPVPIDKLDPKNPFAYCETFDQKYQSSCKSQLMKVATMNMDMEDWLQACETPGLSKATINICINITSGVYIRSKLSFSDTATLPKEINRFTEDQQQIAVLGAAEAFSGYFSDGSEKNWQSFCDDFDNARTVLYCTKTFTDMVTNNSAPWMQRTDIR